MSITNELQQTDRFTYDALDQVMTLADGLGHTTSWGHNQYGWLTSKSNTLTATIIQYARDANGRLTNRWMMGTNTGYTFDAVGNLKAVIYPDANITFSYDAANRRTNMVDAVGTTTFRWTGANQLAREIGPWATVAYAYNQGHRASLTLGDWSQSYSYDNAWRLSGLSSPAGSFTYQYNSGSSPLPVKIQLPNAASIFNSYDSLARMTNTALANYWGQIVDGSGYIRDPLGLPTSIIRELGMTTNTVTPSYDAIDQVTGWSAKELTGALRQNEQFNYGFDAAGNLHFRTNGALVQTFTVDSLNQLSNVVRTGTFTVSGALPSPATNVTVNGTNRAQLYNDLTFAATNNTLANGSNAFTIIATNLYGFPATNSMVANLPASVSFQYDANGNLDNDGMRSFQYDAENQLTNVWVTGQWQVGFLYDGLNRRRVEQDSTWSGGSWHMTNETRLIYNGTLLIQECDINDNVLVTYTRGLDLSHSRTGAGGIGALLARTDTNGSVYYHSDAQGNVTALIDSYQHVSARYEYDAFGKLIGKWGSLADANRMQFSSMPAYRGIIGYPYRFYDPNLGRWLNRDPIQERGGLNLYRAMYNNSLAWVDSQGLDNLFNPGAGENAPPSMNFTMPVPGGPVTSTFQGGDGDPFLAMMGAGVAGGVVGGFLLDPWLAMNLAQPIFADADRADNHRPGSQTPKKPNPCPPGAANGSNSPTNTPPAMAMAKKPDIKFIDYLQKKFGFDDDDRELIHEEITGQNLSKEEIIDVVKGILEIPE